MLWLICMVGVAQALRLTRGVNTNVETIHVLIEMPYFPLNVGDFVLNSTELSMARDLNEFATKTTCKYELLEDDIYEITCKYLYEKVTDTVIDSKISVDIHHYAGSPRIHEWLNLCPRSKKFICVKTKSCIETKHTC